MKTSTKILIALGLSAIVGGGYLYPQKKKAAKNTSTDYDTPDEPLPTKSKSSSSSSSTSAKVDMYSYVTKGNKAQVQVMQKMIGVVPDGVWGPKTDAALKTIKGLTYPFSLKMLQAQIEYNRLLSQQPKVVQIKTDIKSGDSVYAKKDGTVSISKDGLSRLTKGQYIGKAYLVFPSSIAVKNNYGEVVTIHINDASKYYLF